MRKVCIRLPLLLALETCFLVTLTNPAPAQSADLITQAVNTQKVVRVNDVHPLAQAKYQTGRLPANMPLKRMILTLKINPTQKAQLDEFVRQTTDPTSLNYHKWITPAQFGEKYGPSQADLDKVQAWLTGQGLSVDKVAASRTYLEFSGTSAQVEKAFQTELHTYNVNGQTHKANSVPSAVPEALADVVAGAQSLNDFFSLPDSIKKNYTISGDNHFHIVTPADFATIYDINPLYKAGIDGTGQTIGIIGRSNISVQDMTTFRTITGLPPLKLNVIIDGPDPGLVPSDSEGEQLLDVSNSGAVAPNATIDLIISQNTAFTDGTELAAAYAVNNNIAPILSESYSRCELAGSISLDLFDSYLREQAAAQGITYIMASGDSGPAGCDGLGSPAASFGYSVSAIAATPFDVAVGGTQFNDLASPSTYWNSTNSANLESALSYIPEQVWDTNGVVEASGGGPSSLFAKPAWQTGPGVPNDGSRDVPDIAFLAGGDSGYLVCEADAGQPCTPGSSFIFVFQGTSGGAPAFAGVMALVNQQTASIQGNANPAIYAMANNATLYPKAFHDITSVSNDVPSITGGTLGYQATTGYDLTSGWGTLDVNQFVTNFKAVGTGATTLAITANQAVVTHGQDVTFNVTLSPKTGTAIPTGDVAFYASNSAGTQTLGFQSYDGTTNTYVYDTGGYVPGGKLTVWARYAGDANFAPSTSNSVTVQVNPEPSTVTLDYPSILPPLPFFPEIPITTTWGSALSAAVQVVGANSQDNSPTGKVTLTVNGSPATSISLTSLGEDAQAAYNYTPINVPAFALPAGSYSLVANYSGDLAYLGSASPTYTLNVGQDSSTALIYVDKPAPLPNTKITVQAFVAEGSGTFNPSATGMVTFIDNGAAIGNVLLPAKAIQAPSGLYGYLATIPVTYTATGTHTIQASYSGDANVQGTISPVFNITVAAKSPTSSTVAAPGSTQGQQQAGSIVFTDTVVGDSNGPTPTGTVIFSDGTTSLGSATLVAGIATFTTTSLALGSHRISATYNGDSNFESSVSPANVLNVVNFTVSASSATSIVQAGAVSAPITITATDSSGFFGNNAIPIAFTCSGLPTGTTCIFSPSTEQFNPVSNSTSFSAATSVTFTTVGPTLSTASLRVKGSTTKAGLGATGGLTLAALLLCIPFLGKRLRKFGMLAILAAVGLLAGIDGCGSSGPPQYNIANPGTPAGTANVTITATAGSTVQTTTIALTVTSAITQE